MVTNLSALVSTDVNLSAKLFKVVAKNSTALCIAPEPSKKAKVRPSYADFNFSTPSLRAETQIRDFRVPLLPTEPNAISTVVGIAPSYFGENSKAGL